MRRLSALIISICLIFGNTLAQTSCLFPDSPDNDKTGDSGNSDIGNGTSTEINDDTKVKIPEYKDYGRSTVNFADMEYTRPSFDDAIEKCNGITLLIENNEVDYKTLHDAVWDFDGDVILLQTMAAYAEIQSYINPTLDKWSVENAYIGEGYPLFSQAYEKLLVAAANSPHAQKFEVDCFGEGFIEEYKDGGRYTDRLVLLMADEAELENEYSSLSTATVEIDYNGMTDSVDDILYYYREAFGEESYEFKLARDYCLSMYETVYDDMCIDLLVSLLRVRRLIADELGYLSYRDYAYETLYHDYDAEKAEKLIREIGAYILPVYLNARVYADAVDTDSFDRLCRGDLINTSYDILKETDGEIADMYAYMLQHGLYNIEKENENRFVSFTTYLDKYEAPFLFMSTAGNVSDYTTMMHEFGHFADFYINYGESSSLDLAEVSSQGLEFLMLTRLENTISQNALKALTDYQMLNALLVLIYQGFYSEFENIAYKLEYDKINESSLASAMSAASTRLGLGEIYDLAYVNIPHIMLYPFYVQSYCTSLIAALEIYFLEISESGAGFAAYKTLLKRGNTDLSFEGHLKYAGLSSPFDEGVVKKIANGIHCTLVGWKYFEEPGKEPIA